MDIWSVVAWGLVVVAMINIFLGVMVLAVRPYQHFHVWAGVLALACGIWSFGIAAFIGLRDTGAGSELIVRGYYVAAATIGFALLELALTFPTMYRQFRRWQFVIVPVFIAIIALSIWSGLVQSIYIGDLGAPMARLGTIQYASYVVYFVVFACTSITLFMVRYFRAVKLRHKKEALQLDNMVRGMVIALTIGMIFNLILPVFGNYSLIWVGPPFTLVFVGAILYGIIRHELFDVRLAVVRTSMYVVVGGGLIVLFGIVAAWLLHIESDRVIAFVGFATVLAVLLQPLKRIFDRVTDALFFQDRYDPDEFYIRLSELLSSTTDLRNLLEKTTKEIATTIKAETATLVIHSGQTHVSAGTVGRMRFPMEDFSDVKQYVEQDAEIRGIIVTDQLEDANHVRRILRSHKVAILLPLIHRGEMIGFLILGEQLGRGYTNRDKKVLETISEELVIAIQNAISVQAVRDINANLEQRVAAATAELRTTNARLTRLDAAKDEFLSIASHQLRTPLTSIKGYLSMVLEGDMGKVPKAQQQVLSEAFASSERMVHLIHDFLNVSRLQTGKFALELGHVDILALVKHEIKSLEAVAKGKGITLKFIDECGPCDMELDETKLQQVVMNFIDNAIFYSHADSTITITLKKTADAIEYTVHDTGIGVPKAEQSRLFEKFFRATNARKQRPDGTGVGIFLAKTVVDAHGGKIIFHSEEGVGSTFGFRLPLKRSAEPTQR